MRRNGLAAMIACLLPMLLATLAGCGSPMPDGVTVTGKRHEPARHYTTMVPVSTGRSTVLVPVVHHDDEDWVLIVSWVDLSHDPPRERSGVLYVDQATYERVEVGDLYWRDGREDMTDRDTRERGSRR